MTPTAVITAAPDTLLLIAPPDVIARLAVIANALIEAHSGAGDCAAAGKCLRRYPPLDDADTDTDTDTDGNDAGDAAGGSADLTSSGKLRCIALTNTGQRCMRARQDRQSYCTFHINLPARQPAATPPTPAPAPLANDAGVGAGAGAGLCAATAKVSGNPCRRIATAGSHYCHYHRDWDTDDAPPPDTPPPDTQDTPAPDVPPATAPPADTPAPLPPQQAPQTAPQPDGDGDGDGDGNDAGAGAGVAPWVIAAAGCQQPDDCLQPDCLSYRTGQCRPDGIPGHLRRPPQPSTTPAATPATATPTAPTGTPAATAGATATPAATAPTPATASAGPCPHCGASPAMRQRDGDGHLRCLACARYLDPPPLSADEAAADRAGYRHDGRPRVAAAAAA